MSESRPALNAPARFRMLPASKDAEESVIASYLIDPETVGGICVEMGITSEWFHMPALGTIYGLLAEMTEKRLAIDVVQLIQALSDRNRLAECGGHAYLSTLSTLLPTALNVTAYITTLKEKHALRNLIHVGVQFASRSYEEQSEVWDIVDEFEIAALAVRPQKNVKEITGPKETVFKAVEAIQDTYEKRGSITGIATGFSEFDRISDGLHNGEMIVIAARPSNGKTALAMNIAEELAVNQQRPVAVFSLEMSKLQLIQRILCSMARINLARIRDGFLSDRDFPRLTAAASRLAEAPLYIDDSSGLNIQEIRARARRLKQKFKIQAVFVDYLQLAHGSSKRSQENRNLEVAEVSSGMKEMAKELGLPVVVLAQLGRDFEKRGPNARPRLSDLRESGAIEQDADVIAFLTRPELYEEDEQKREDLRGIAELMLAKQRNGPTGDIPLTFLKEFTRFETRASCEELQDEVNQTRLRI